MSGNRLMDNKKLYMMRHGSILERGYDYENLSYDEFMPLFLKTKNPPLRDSYGRIKNIIVEFISEVSPNSIANYLQARKYKIKDIPKNIEVIYCSRSRRSLQTANLIQWSLNNRPKIDKGLTDLLAEVTFTKDILSRGEFEKKGGWEGCRPVIFKRWFEGNNIESFEDTLGRIKKLDELIRKSKYQSILLLTHGIMLRAIYLYYSNKLKFDSNGKLSRTDETFNELLAAPRLEYGGMIEYVLNGTTKIVQGSVLEEPLELKKIRRKNKKRSSLLSLI